MKGLAAAMVEVFLDLRSMRALCPSVADAQNCPAPKVLRSVAIVSAASLSLRPRISKALVRARNGGPYRRRRAEQAPTFAADLRSMDHNESNLIRIVMENG